MNINIDNLIESKNAVYETLKANHNVKTLYVENGSKDAKINEMIEMAKSQHAVIKFLDKDKLNELSKSKKHQGIIAEILDYSYVDVDDILNYAKEKGEDPFIVILDEIEDPHNFGAIIRTCVCAGVHGIIIKNRNQSQVTKTVIEVSSGATNYIKIARVVNLSQVIEQLKKEGIFIYASSMEGQSIYKTNLKGKIAIVVGNEGKGISRLVKDNSDSIIKIPQVGLIDSLNASVASGVILYEIFRQRNN